MDVKERKRLEQEAKVENRKRTGRKIKAIREMRGLTQTEVSLKAGWKGQPSRLSNYERGEREPDITDLPLLAKVLDIDIGYLYSPAEPACFVLGERDRVTHRFVTWLPILEWTDIVSYQTKRPVVFKSMMTTTQPVGARSFGLCIESDGMQSREGGETFLRGSHIIVDPDHPLKDQHFVVVQLQKETAPTLRQWVIDGGVQFLKPLNPQYPASPMTSSMTILGVVRELVRHFV